MAALNLRRRSVGLSIIATLLGALAVSGLINTFIWATMVDALPLDTPTEFRAGVRVLASPAASAAAILYAIAALCAAVGTWKMREWAPHAILIWGVSGFILGGIFTAVSLQILRVSWGIIVYVGAGVVAAAVVGAIWSYVRRETSDVAL
jgi:hypothetical protein